MQRVKMLQDDIVSWGPVRLFKDEVVELPEDVVASLIGRGIAELVPDQIVVVDTPVVFEPPLDEPESDEPPAPRPARSRKPKES